MKKGFLTLAAAFMLLALPVSAKDFQEGMHYVPIKPAPQVGQGEEVEVVEFFMYTCPHCKDFDPVLKDWRKKQADNVKFVHIPAMFGGAANLHAKVFYALEVMGEGERLHMPLFSEIHDKGNRLKDRDAIENFLQQQGVDMDKFRKAMSSFAVAAKTNRANALMRRYGIRSVPSMVVDGRYRSGKGFTSYEEITEVVDVMVAKSLELRKAAN